MIYYHILIAVIALSSISITTLAAYVLQIWFDKRLRRDNCEEKRND